MNNMGKGKVVQWREENASRHDGLMGSDGVPLVELRLSELKALYPHLAGPTMLKSELLDRIAASLERGEP